MLQTLVQEFLVKIINNRKNADHRYTCIQLNHTGDRRARDLMVVRFTTTNAISAHHHWSCEFESCSWRGVLDTTLCDKRLSM